MLLEHSICMWPKSRRRDGNARVASSAGWGPCITKRDDDVHVVPPSKCSCTVLGSGWGRYTSICPPRPDTKPGRRCRRNSAPAPSSPPPGASQREMRGRTAMANHSKAMPRSVTTLAVTTCKVLWRGLGPKYLLYSTQAVSWIVIDIPGPNQPDLSRYR